MTNQLTVIAHLVARPDKVEEVKAYLLSLVGATRADAGCIEYHLHQSVEVPANFAFYENWVSRAALDEHMEMPLLQQLIARKDELFAVEPDIRQFTMISQR